MRVLLCISVLALAASAGLTDAEGLIFYMPFEQGGLHRCGSGWSSEVFTRANATVPGRFGKGVRMERARTNLLTPNQASVEQGVAGFTAGEQAQLSAVAAGTPYGTHVLQASAPAPGVLWTLQPRELRAQAYNRSSMTFVLSTYLRSDKPGAKVRLTLRDALEDKPWRQTIESENKAALEKDPQAKIKEPVATVAQPGELAPTAEWRRVMALLEIDVRRKTQSLVGGLELLEGGPVVVLADGLQLEQAALYPLPNTAPTSWLPGGEPSGPSWLHIAADTCDFTGEAGTLACWVRALPDECGGVRSVGPALAIGTGWFAPVWTLGSNMWYATNGWASRFQKGRMSAGDIEKRLTEEGTRQGWHHLALVWDDREAVGYFDGQRVGRCDAEYGKLAYGSMIRLGGSYLEQHPMTGDLDEVCLFNRRMSDEEIGQMAEREQAMSDELAPVTLQLPRRLTFLRSEAEAVIPLEPNGGGSVTMKAEAPAFQAVATGKAAPGKPLLLKFKPWLAESGKYPLRVEVSSGQTKTVVEDQIEVFDEPQGRFIIYAWGGTEDLEKLGFNCAVTGGAGQQRELLERGLWANSRIDIRDSVPHPWSPWNRKRSEIIARSTARGIMANPNVVACLVNSEMGDPPFPNASDEPWFYDWMKRETGLGAIPPQIARDPMHMAQQKDAQPLAVLPEDYAPLKFLRWWNERGQGWWLLNNQLARWMREEGLRTTYYSDQPEAVEQFADMDMIDYWGYPKAPEGLVARFNHAANMAKLLGKRFQAMPGTVYWDDGNGLWVTDTDGKRKVLCLSPDCLRENLWLSVACPSHSVGLYGLGERKTEVYDPACDQVMAETYGLMQPVGTLVGGLPAEQPAVAMLETDGLDFTQPDIYDNWIRHWVMRNTGRILARARLPFDWITEAHVQAGWLQRYKAIVLPGAWCLPEKTHQALVAYAKQGGLVVADKVLRAEIPGAQRVNVETQAGPQEAMDSGWGAWARQYRDQQAGFMQVEPRDKVFTYTREVGRARYLFIVNDSREPGPQYERFKITQMAADGGGPLRDRGLPQDVTVSVPAGLALYDILRHEAIKAEARGERQQFTLHLDPGAAAVIAALPQPITRLAVDTPATLKPGTEGLLKVRVLDKSGKPVQGRQLVEIRVTTPQGQWAGLQRYMRVENGSLDLPLRLPLTAIKGQWQVEVREWLSGAQTERTVIIR